ncbi:fungal hydrophobin [Mycena latifolia]|nr:fungal hydrophobin [Mycena latifolia]
MFSKLSVVVTSVLMVLAFASPSGPPTRPSPAPAVGTPPPPITPPVSPQCCLSVLPASSVPAAAVASLVGLDLTGLTVSVGLSCSPITVAGNNCTLITVTCDLPLKAWGGLIAINCIPITL